MDSKTIVEQLNKLPKGYISKKKIRGKEYSYLQFFEDGALKSEYISEARLDEIKSGLIKRKELEEIIKEEKERGKKLPIVSYNARKLSGSLMMSDERVAEFEDGRMTFLNKEKCPLLIKRTGSLASFLSSRIIDSSRTNARILKKAMSISEKDDAILSLYAHGAVITDNYWFKPKQSKLKYKDIIFTDDVYADLCLEGIIYFFPKTPRYTPQLTLGGSYEKCWKYLDGKWILYKKGSPEEIFSEITASRIAKLLGISTANYEAVENNIRTENFAAEYNYEPMSSVAGDDDTYSHVFECLNEYGKDIRMQYLKLILFDAIVSNVDRHNENCGLLRDKHTGRIVSLAPNFDNNMALISRSRILNQDPKNDGFIKLFVRFVKENRQAREYYKYIYLKELNREMLYSIMEDALIPIEKEELVQYIMNRYHYLCNVTEIGKLHV